MSLTPSNMMPLGTRAPDFRLADVVSGNDKTLNDLKGENGLLVMFICVHCPYVIHIQESLTRLANDLRSKGIGSVAISSNDIDKYPDDRPEEMIKQAESVGFEFPYLFDESQEVARSYQAACTPDLYLFDTDLKCFYRGRMDEAKPGNDKPNDGCDLKKAVDDMLAGKEPTEPQYPSMGCNIKWK